MSSISIRRSHSLSHERVVAAVNVVAERLKDEYAVKSRWRGSSLHFERIGLNGTMNLAPKELTLNVELGFLLSVFRDSIAREIERTLDDELAAKHTRAKHRRK